jgi:alkylated DNA repair dioxygenase AlkB
LRRQSEAAGIAATALVKRPRQAPVGDHANISSAARRAGAACRQDQAIITTSRDAEGHGRGAAVMPTNLLPYDGEVRLVAAALARGDADRLLGELVAATAWRREEATVMGRRLPIPRLTAWHGEKGYVYSGIRLEPAPWSPPLLELKAVAEAIAGETFNSVLLNLYRDGRDSVSWHADNERGLGTDPVIASLSLGAVRRFQLRHRRTRARVDLDLPHGSCLIMAGATQHHWLHQIPKTARPIGPRLNLTFRRMR